jgi:hypothetical protein
MLKAFHEIEGHCRVPQTLDVLVVVRGGGGAQRRKSSAEQSNTNTLHDHHHSAHDDDDDDDNDDDNDRDCFIVVDEGGTNERVDATADTAAVRIQVADSGDLDSSSSSSNDNNSDASAQAVSEVVSEAVVVKLGHWVATQRVAFHKGRLNQGRIERLASLGFVWDAQAASSPDPFPPRRLVLHLDDWQQAASPNQPAALPIE